MKKKQMIIIPKSMQKDLAVSQFPNDAAYELRNMRIVTTGDNTSLCLVNEKSNSEVLTIDGIVIGAQVLNNYAVLFVTNPNLTNGHPDSIIRLKNVDDTLQIDKILYNGNLGFKESNPIESISIYENENVQKVYWVDGINQPRIINICNTYGLDNDTQFDFVPQIYNLSDSPTSVDIEIVENVSTLFPGGVIQYVFSYYNKNAQSTPVIYQSPLYYTSDSGRGLNPDGTQKANSSFKLSIYKLDRSFEYCRIYRLLRTSIDSTPTIQILGDYNIDSSSPEENYINALNNTLESGTSNSNLYFKYDGGEFKNTGDIIDIFEEEYKDKIINTSTYINGINTKVSVINSKNTFTNKALSIYDSSTDFTYTINAHTPVLIIYSDMDFGNYNLSTVKGVVLSSLLDPLVPSGGFFTGIRNSIILYDSGRGGDNIDPLELLYLGGTELIASTITNKDNTLFLGDINLKRGYIAKEDKESIKDNSILSYELQEVSNDDSIDYLDNQWNTNSNLLKSSKESTFFQYGEVYRFGVQFLSRTGIWSEVVYLGDKENDKRVVPNRYNDGINKKPVITAKISIPDNLRDDFIGARLVCVYPTINDRNVLCQGLVCSTLYNLKDRNDNAPYVQSSWFARPEYSRYTEFPNHPIMYPDKTEFHRGTLLEYRMVGEPKEKYNSGEITLKDRVIGLPSGKYYNGEIYCAGNSPQRDFEDSQSEETRESTIDKYKNYFGIDKRIVTMHSPELDEAFDDEMQNILTAGLKFRVVGYAVVKTTLSDSVINFSNPFVPKFSGVFNKDVSSPSDSQHVYGFSLVNFPMWADGIAVEENETYPGSVGDLKGAASFPIYPWHRNGSLSNQGKTIDSLNRKSILNSKTFSNLRITLPTTYLDSPYTMDISNVELWSDTDANTIKKINVQDLWGIQDIVYRGNCDKVLVYEGDALGDETAIRIQNYHLDHNYDFSKIPNDFELPTETGDKYVKVSSLPSYFFDYIKDANKRNTDPVPIQYKSTGHAVFAFGKSSDGKYIILPNISNMHAPETGSGPTNLINYGNETTNYPEDKAGLEPHGKLPWLHNDEVSGYKGLLQHTIEVNDSLLDYTVEGVNNGLASFYYIIGELYRENVANRFGGDTEQALRNNMWCPCGDTVLFNSHYNITLIGDQGDTYFGRYDHLKTYPSTKDNVNNIVDIVSFCCETRINVDGRYDKNRGNKNNLSISPVNFNLFNKAYSQKNNFFNYNYLEEGDTDVAVFPNSIMWSKTKSFGEKIDSWVGITPTSILDLDGDKGSVTALRRFNNEIYAFQDTGISRILFNSRTQISTSDGIPIEIANSGKVDGKVYITDKYGCANKWSIAETPSGLYFTDDSNQCILSFSGEGITDITYTKNMYSWIKDNIGHGIWSPINNRAIRTLYDKNTNDIYFTTRTEALSFNEKIGAFSSFYDYNNVSWNITIGNNTYQFDNNMSSKKCKIWKLHGGEDYCNLFGFPKTYSISVIANPEFQLDKVFDTIEFRTNGTEPFKYGITNKYPFRSLSTVNEYQTAVSGTDKLKKKFRAWRWQIGRNTTGRDRIRNPWAKITMTGNSNEEVRLYDTIVTYYV